MPEPNSPLAIDAALSEMLGYLNFSAGKPDAKFQKHVSDVCGQLDPDQPWAELDRRLREQLAAVRGKTAAFRDVSQAEAVVGIVFEKALPAYREHHADLLAHLSDRELFQPYFIARVFEAVLAEGGPWHESQRIVRGTLARLNDFVGHRPVAVLERQKCEPYQHERVRPIPLYLRGAGVAIGKYHEIVTRAIEILAATDPEILADAHFNLELLDELAIDPRAYDFGHPVNQRPNYQFGEWDPHTIDNAGQYRRFVVRQVTLDALLERVQGSGFRVQELGIRGQESTEERVEASGKTVDRGTHLSGPQPSTLNPQPPEPLLFESAAVLAGTMLMAAGTSGSGPDAHDSSVTLATLVPKIAKYRDEFYSSLLGAGGDTSPTRKRGGDATQPSLARRATVASISGEHGDRLRQEAATLRQPFGGARQHLNAALARRRAEQLQAVHLARLFAEMGLADAGRKQARRVATLAARITCEIECRVTASHRNLDRGELTAAVAEAAPLDELLRRGIACGAIVDPWNILGFQGQFSIFPALENSVPDPRVDQLIRIMEQLFELSARLLAEAAAAGATEIERELTKGFRQLAAWWDRFATVEVSSVERVHGGESLAAATRVARALAAWRQAGAASGDIKFWRQHSEEFPSPGAYTRVVSVLLEKHDHLAAMALLVSWLSRVAEVPLEDADHSFHELARRWLAGAHDQDSLVKKFFDYVEANAEEYWEVPGLSLGQNSIDDAGDDSPDDAESGDGDDDGDSGDEVYSAAYDGVTFRDSAEDGHDGALLEGGPTASEFDLDAAADRIEPRLEFLATLASLWRIAATEWRRPGAESTSTDSHAPPEHSDAGTRDRPVRSHPEQPSDADWRAQSIRDWLGRLDHNQRGLGELLAAIQEHAIPQSLGSHDSLIEYDRRRSIKAGLIETVMATEIATTEAARQLAACLPETPPDAKLSDWQQHAADFDRCLTHGDATVLRTRLPRLLAALDEQPLLYRRLDKGGHPREIVAARCVRQELQSLVESLPRAGLLRETYEVLRVARTMEIRHPVRGEGVTEFDHLFRVGLRSAVESILEFAAAWPSTDQADEPLLDTIEEFIEPFLKMWLEHSQSLRLSSLDRIGGDAEWLRLRQFIERYGHDLLTPKFLTFGNLRAVLDHGAARYFEYLENDRDPLHPVNLIDDLDRAIRRDDAARLLELVMQVFVENYEEYRDYNTTTAQSDYGERYFILFEFLRLKSWYDRTSWNLQPVAIVHEQLVRAGRNDAARLWEDAFGQRTAEVADQLSQRLAELERQCGVRLATVRDRLAERFTKPLALDRLRLSIEPAMQEAAAGMAVDRSGLARFESELREFAATATGAGLDVPRWLRALANEVERVQAERDRPAESTGAAQCRRAVMSFADLQEQLEHWDNPTSSQ